MTQTSTRNMRNLGLDDAFRARIVLYFSLSLAIWAPVYSFIMYRLAADIEVVVATMGCMILVGISPFLLHRTGSFWVVGNWLAFNVTWEMWFVSVYMGYGPAPLFWLAVVPLLALLISGTRSGFFWLALSTLIMVSHYYGIYQVQDRSTGLSPRAELLFEGAVLAGLYLLVLLLAMGYERVKTAAISQLRASQERERRIVETAADAILTIDAEGRIETINQAGCEIFDRTREQLTGTRFHILVPAIALPPPQPSSLLPVATFDPDRPPAPDAAVGLSDWAGRRYEALGMRPEAVPLPLEIAIERLDLGEDERYVVVARDLTVRKALEAQQQEALQRSKESFAALIENLPDGIIVHNDGLIQYLNPAAGQMLRCEADDDLVGKPIAHLLPEDEGEAFSKRVEEARDATGVVRFDEHHLRPSTGIDVVVESATFQAEFQSEMANISIVRDLTERKKSQARIMQMERMSAVGTLAAGVAHEINNPLTFVRSNLEFLSDEIQSTRLRQLPASAQDELGAVPDNIARNYEWSQALHDAVEGADRIRNIVSNLSTYTRERHTDVKPLNLREVVESTLAMASHEIKHRAQVVCDFHDVDPVLADGSSMSQVFLNLLINAAHAIPETSALDHEIRVSIRQHGSKVHVDVQDTGTGIPAEIMGQIFDPFFTTKSIAQGTGLGLAICQNIVQEFHGRIEVETEVGKGTTFSVRFPSAHSQHESLVDASNVAVNAPDDESLEPARILIIDDEVLVAKSLDRLLRSYRVCDVQEAQDALSMIRMGATFDVILCDLMMAGMTGMEFYEKLLIESPNMAGRVIFMTGGAVTEKASSFVRNSGSIFLSKPFKRDELHKKIDEMLSHSNSM